MPLDAKSSSEEVERFLPLSRKACKRALGGLYKEEKIYFEDGKTFLKK
jgi:predicted RNA-binding protein (virulence factor B family)